MRLLLDTHVAIWAVGRPELLPEEIRNTIVNADSVAVSAVSVWEIALKHTTGRTDRPALSGEEAVRHFGEAGYRFLELSADHAAAVDKLPMIHRDPFDRVLVAQALHESMRLVTIDAAVARYSPSFITW